METSPSAPHMSASVIPQEEGDGLGIDKYIFYSIPCATRESSLVFLCCGLCACMYGCSSSNLMYACLHSTVKHAQSEELDLERVYYATV